MSLSPRRVFVMTLALSVLVILPRPLIGQAADDCAEKLETVSVPVDGTAVRSDNTLELRRHHRVVVSGTFAKEGPGQADAEYSFSRKGLIVDKCDNQLDGLDQGLAFGERGEENPEKVGSWGKYNPKHVYQMHIVGRDRRLSLRYQDCRILDNSGSLEVTIYKCERFEKIK